MAPTQPSSERYPSLNHIQTPVPILASLSLSKRCTSFLAAVVSSSMVVLTTNSSPGGGQSVPSVVRACPCYSLITLHVSAPEEGLWCSSFSLPLHAFASLAANRCCLESRITGTGVSPHCLIRVPCGVVGSAPRIDLACRLRRSWMSSRLPTSLGSHPSSFPYSATAWTDATWTAHTFCGTTLYVLVTVRSPASAALAFFMHRLCCSSRSPSIFLTFIKLTILPFATLGKAALLSKRSTPVMWPFLQAA